MGDVEIDNQHIAWADRSDAFGEGTGILLGLGFPSMSAYNFTPVFDHLMEMEVLKNNIFSFWFSLDAYTPSELLMGYINAQKFEGEIEYFPVVDKQFWTIKLEDLKVKYFVMTSCRLATNLLTFVQFLTPVSLP